LFNNDKQINLILANLPEIKRKPVGVIGAGSFGTAIANLLAVNMDVYIFSRKEQVVQNINSTHHHLNIALSPRITATTNLQKIAEEAILLFLIVPSANFRNMMQNLAPFLKPSHILIHGTKGLEV